MSSKTASRATPAAFSALAASDVIVADYRRYLQSLVEPRLKPYRDSLFEQIKTIEISAKGLILEATPPFRSSGVQLRTSSRTERWLRRFRELDCRALPKASATSIRRMRPGKR